jgi:hypothetical protein
MGGESEPLRVLNEFWPAGVAIFGASVPHSRQTELVPALDHVSAVRGERFHIGDPERLRLGPPRFSGSGRT